MTRTIDIRRTLIAALIAALALTACSKEEPAGPDKSNWFTLGDLTLTLVVDKQQALPSELFNCEVQVEGGPADVVSQLEFTWTAAGAGSGGVYQWHGGIGFSTFSFQPTNVAEQYVEVYVRVAEQENSWERMGRDLDVVGPGIDGSTNMLPVPAGAFMRGLDASSTDYVSSTPKRQLDVSAFEIAQTEVTNDLARVVLQEKIDDGTVVQFGQELILQPPGTAFPIHILDLAASSLNMDVTTLWFPPSRSMHPVFGMTWYGAALFCNFLSQREGLAPCYTFAEGKSPLIEWEVSCDFNANGYRLPTEAEWEKAARGGVVLADGSTNAHPERAFPWGDAPVFETLASRQRISRYAHYGEVFFYDIPVGSFPLGASPYGALDMFGSMSEWVWDWYEPDYYALADGVDPRGPENTTPGLNDWKVIRGGSVDGIMLPEAEEVAGEHDLAVRSYVDPETVFFVQIGFRLARTP